MPRCARRRAHAELRSGSYAGTGLAWHGALPGEPDWSEASRLVAYTLPGAGGSGGLYIAFNSSHRPQVLQLPHWHGRAWQLVSDTGKARGGLFSNPLPAVLGS
jgi:hypothetical protein